MNGADVAQEGTLRAVEGEGIVIEQSTQPLKTYWIPYQVILTVEFTAPKGPVESRSVREDPQHPGS
jgi:hypothetical protein